MDSTTESDKRQADRSEKLKRNSDFGWSPYLERFDQSWWDEDRQFFVVFSRHVHGEYAVSPNYSLLHVEDDMMTSNDENLETREDEDEDSSGDSAENAQSFSMSGVYRRPSGIFRVVVPHGGGVNPLLSLISHPTFSTGMNETFVVQDSVNVLDSVPYCVVAQL